MQLCRDLHGVAASMLVIGYPPDFFGLRRLVGGFF